MIAEFIKQERKKRGLTQTALAKIAGIKNINTISRIENGKVKPSAATLQKFSKAFKIKVEKFYI